MKPLKALAILFFAIGLTPNSGAKSAQQNIKSPAKQASSLSTDIRFSGGEVLGKYRHPGEAIATVENEKLLLDLIEPRRDFKDRLKKAVTQR